MDSTFDEVTESRSQEGESRPTLAKRTSIEAQAFAGFWIRFWAFILDWLVVWGVNHLTVSPIFSLFGWSKGEAGFPIFRHNHNCLSALFCDHDEGFPTNTWKDGVWNQSRLTSAGEEAVMGCHFL